MRTAPTAAHSKVHLSLAVGFFLILTAGGKENRDDLAQFLGAKNLKKVRRGSLLAGCRWGRPFKERLRGLDLDWTLQPQYWPRNVKLSDPSSSKGSFALTQDILVPVDRKWYPSSERGRGGEFPCVKGWMPPASLWIIETKKAEARSFLPRIEKMRG